MGSVKDSFEEVVPTFAPYRLAVRNYVPTWARGQAPARRPQVRLYGTDGHSIVTMSDRDHQLDESPHWGVMDMAVPFTSQSTLYGDNKLCPKGAEGDKAF